MAENEKIVETVSTKLARIEENLRNLIDTNTACHKKLMENQETLIKHVNDENEKMNTRVTFLEKCEAEQKAMRKGELRAYKVATGLLSIIVTVVGLLKAFGLF